MKIGVVADTHSLLIPQSLWEELKSVDMIIHAGDFCTRKDYEKFAKIAETKAVFGNMDDGELTKILPEVETVQVENITIGIYHGHGPAKLIIDAVKDRMKGIKVDVIVFGHSHQPFNDDIDGKLFFNPGSPNDNVNAPYHSYGILTVSGNQVSGKIIKLKG